MNVRVLFTQPEYLDPEEYEALLNHWHAQGYDVMATVLLPYTKHVDAPYLVTTLQKRR